MPLVAVPDSCVLFPASVRDTILYAAGASLFQVKLTDDILDEVCRNLVPHLVKKGKSVEVAQEAIQRLRESISRAFEEAFVDNHRELINNMPINAKDRHVMAAAVASGASVIITENLKDFPRHLLDPYHIKAQGADDFLVDLFYDNPAGMTDVVANQSWKLHRPSKSMLEVLDGLRLHAPLFSSLVRREMNLTSDEPWPAEVKAKGDIP